MSDKGDKNKKSACSGPATKRLKQSKLCFLSSAKIPKNQVLAKMSSGPPPKRLRQTVLNYKRRPAGSEDIQEQKSAVADDSSNHKATVAVEDSVAKTPTPHFDGYTVTKTATDGNCLFHALSHQLLNICGVAKTALCVRQEIVEFLRMSPAANNELLAIGIDPDHYLAQMEQDGTWGDGVMLSAAATLFRVSIKVLMEDGTTFVIGKETVNDSAQLTVGFVSMSGASPNHFISLLCEAKSTATRQFHEMTEKASTCSPDISDEPVESHENAFNDVAQVPTDALCRPHLQLYPKTTFGQQQRAFSKSLYDKYNFIEYSVKADAVFCFPCRFFGSKSGHSFEKTFTVSGFRNWKKSERLQDHADSKYHKDSMAAWSQFKLAATHGNVFEQQSGYHAFLVKENREYMKTLARIAVFCARQNIALRGHDENVASENRGNFLELADLIASESKDFEQRRSNMPANATYLSSDSQNALIEAAARCVLSKIQKELENAGMYAIISDCCTDMVADNLSLCVRYVDMEDCVVRERFIQFTQLSANELDAASITNNIIAMLQQKSRFNVALKDCVAQASDGASVMSGKDNGVQKLFRSKVDNPCVFVHCYAHRLNLVLSVSATEVDLVKEFFDMIRKIISYINLSAKRKAVFSDMQLNDPAKLRVIHLPDLCEHKWNFRERAVSVICSRYSHVVATLVELAKNGKKDERFDAECHLARLTKPTTVCLLIIMSDVFSQLAALSDVLQAESCDLASALQLAATHLQLLREKRSTEYFNKLWLKVSELAEKSNIDMSIPSKRKTVESSRLKRGFMTESTLGHRSTEDADRSTVSLHDHYRVTCFMPIMDRCINEMERRFGDDIAMPLFQAISVCHPNSESFLDVAALRPLIDAYHLDSSGSLASQIEVCKLLMKQTGKPRDIPDLISKLNPAGGFPDLRRLLQLALTVPIANVAAERSFSSLRKIRTYVRSTMVEHRLSGIAVLNIEQDLAKNIDYNEVLDIFKTVPQLRYAALAGGDSTEVSARRLEF